MKQLLLILLLVPTVIFSQSNCDSITIDFTRIDSTAQHTFIKFDFHTSFSDNMTWYSYGGFLLTTNSGDTVAFETLETSDNHFGFGQSYTESRKMELHKNIILPFTGQIHVVEGWFAGSRDPASCSYPFTVDETVLSTKDILNEDISLIKITDYHGRTVQPAKNQVQFYHYSDGHSEKVILTE